MCKSAAEIIAGGVSSCFAAAKAVSSSNALFEGAKIVAN
jgi:hypothetical protein